MDDYYELLGVDPDAATEDIRIAYRERKAEVDSNTDAGKDEAARLNKAWNVLSDPYQRGRYDAELESDYEYEDDDEYEDEPKGRSTPDVRTQIPHIHRPPGRLHAADGAGPEAR